MARVVYGSGVTEFIGSIGGLTFQSNKSGFTVRNRPHVPKVRTPSQLNQIQKFSHWSQRFRELGSTDKAQWQDYADNYSYTDYWGRSKPLTALQWYLVVNGAYFHINNSLIDTPYTYASPVNCAPVVLTYYATYFELTTASTFATANDLIFIFLSVPTINQEPIVRKLLLSASATIVGSAGSYDLTSDFETTTGLNYISDVWYRGLKVQVALSCVSLDTFIPSEFVFP